MLLCRKLCFIYIFADISHVPMTFVCVSQMERLVLGIQVVPTLACRCQCSPKCRRAIQGIQVVLLYKTKYKNMSERAFYKEKRDIKWELKYKAQ